MLHIKNHLRYTMYYELFVSFFLNINFRLNAMLNILADTKWYDVSKSLAAAIANTYQPNPPSRAQTSLWHDFNKVFKTAVLVNFGSVDRQCVPPWFLKATVRRICTQAQTRRMWP